MIDSATFKREQGILMETNYFVGFPLLAPPVPATKAVKGQHRKWRQ
jgi:hypothetical protein